MLGTGHREGSQAPVLRAFTEDDKVQPFLLVPPWWDLWQETDHWLQLLSELPFHRMEGEVCCHRKVCG